MSRFNPAQLGDTEPPGEGPPTRRRLLALLGGLSVTGAKVVDCEPHRAWPAGGLGIDPMPRLFAEFRAHLDRHAAALAARDWIETEFIARLGFPRVALPRGSDDVPRHAADAAAIRLAVPPGRRRQRLVRRLRRRQRRWDDAALQFGLIETELREATLDGATLAAADSLLATPAWTSGAVVLKLIVLLSVHAPGPASDQTTPWRELRLILADLGERAARGTHCP